MRVKDILARKGDLVISIAPDDPVTDLVAALARHRVGALVVRQDDQLVGIVSERDIVRRLHTDGVGVLDGPVAEIMTTTLVTVGPDADCDDVMALMTERRIRHVPVLREGSMLGIVSIGDVVKERMDELTAERDHLTTYLTG